MTKSELISLVPNKPYRMPCCRECMGKAKKDCDDNPLNCFDFYLLNKETIDRLSRRFNEPKTVDKYYVIRDKNTGLYFRGKGVNRWGKYFNQASIYRVKGQAEHNVEAIAWRGEEQAEIVTIQIKEMVGEEK